MAAGKSPKELGRKERTAYPLSHGIGSKLTLSKSKRITHWPKWFTNDSQFVGFEFSIFGSSRPLFCSPLVGAQSFWRSLLIGSTYALIFGDDLGAKQQQRRREIQAQQYRDCRRQ